MHDEEFWRECEILDDYDYMREHQVDYSGHRRGGHPVYWTVVWIVAFILAIAFPTSPGLCIFFLLFALSGSTML